MSSLLKALVVTNAGPYFFTPGMSSWRGKTSKEEELSRVW